MDPEALSVDLLRELLRNLLPWRALFTSEGVDTLTCDGISVGLWDIEYLYLVSQQILPIRQRQAIRLCLVQNLSEQDAASIMRIDDTNPVAMYATSGLEKIIHNMRFGLLPSREHVYAQEARKHARWHPSKTPALAAVSASVSAGDDDLYMDL